jgi:predicted RNase H-like HicB family nuclease
MVPSIPGCHTQGRTIAEARRRIREALSLWVDDADEAQLIDEVRLPMQAEQALTQYRVARQRADEERVKAQESTASAVRVLAGELHLSVRDTGELLGLSHQRVQQLLTNPAW